MAKPRVSTKCVANGYTGPNERIVEFSSANGGGLIAFRETPDGHLLISIYNCDSKVIVGVGASRLTEETLAAVGTLQAFRAPV